MSLWVHLGGGPISLRQLAELASTLRELAAEVAAEVPNVGRDAFDFVVEEASTGSFEVVVGVRAKQPGADPGAGARALDAAAQGLRKLNAEAVRPRFFNDRALEAAKRLHAIRAGEITTIRVLNGSAEPTELAPSLPDNVDRILRADRMESIGSVEGRIEMLDIHGKPTFAIWDAVTGRRYDCTFGSDIDLRELLDVFGRRVIVRGLMSEPRSPRGRPKLAVRSFRVLRQPEELPSADDVRGILGS